MLGRSHAYQTGSGSFTNHNFYHADGNGNVTYMLNSAQSKVAEYRYDPFGNTIFSGGTLSAANVYRFSSKENHVNSGMYYYGYRFYDPNLQRWLNRDPLGDVSFVRLRTLNRQRTFIAESVVGNLYYFVGNDSLNRVDLFGLYTVFPDDFIGPLPPDGVRQSTDDFRQQAEGNGISTADDDFALLIPVRCNLFAKGRNVFPTRGLLNANNYLRTGWAWKGTKDVGRDVFRIAWGNGNHIDLWPPFGLWK